MTDLEAFKRMLKRVRGITVIHKSHPQWATADRVIFEAADTKISFSFDHDGRLFSYSWGPHVGQNLGGDITEITKNGDSRGLG